MGRKEVSGANFSHAAGRAGAFFTGGWAGNRIRTAFILPILPEYTFNMGNYRAVLGASMIFKDDSVLANTFDGVGYDPLSPVDSSHRIDLRLAISPPDSSWEVALYGRDVTDERVKTGGAFDLVQKSTDLTAYDGGGTQRARGARWGLQGSYFFGN